MIVAYNYWMIHADALAGYIALVTAVVAAGPIPMDHRTGQSLTRIFSPEVPPAVADRGVVSA